MKTVIRLIACTVIFAACAAAFGAAVGMMGRKPAKPAQAELQWRFAHRGVVEVEYGRCWIILNTLARTTYQSCGE